MDSAPRRRRVLVVEDEGLIASHLAELLGDNGYAVIGPAGTVQAALRLAQDEIVDIAILDLNLCGEPTEPVASLLAQRGVPVLLTTGHSRRYVRTRFRDLPYLEKPVSGAKLCATIAQMLAGRIGQAEPLIQA